MLCISSEDPSAAPPASRGTGAVAHSRDTHSLSGATKSPVSLRSPALNFLISEFSHPTQEVVCSRRRRHRRSPVAVGDGGVSLPPLHHPLPHSMSVPASLFVCFPSCFLFKASKEPPPPGPPDSLDRTSPPSLAPKSPRAVRMICKLQTTESPGLVSAAHLGNSISHREGGGGGRAPCSPSSPFPPLPLLTPRPCPLSPPRSSN